MTDGRGVYLLWSLYIPDADKEIDPEMAADEFAAIINEERRRNAGEHEDNRSPMDVQVGLFPGAQWLTPEVWADIRRLAQRMKKEHELTALSPDHSRAKDIPIGQAQS